MPRIIFTSEYLKDAKSQLKNFIEYIATREGVEKIRQPEKLSHVIKKLEKQIPQLKNYLEYEDYKNDPTVENALELIETAVEYSMESKKNFIAYMGRRPGVERVNEHGLFTSGDEPLNLKQVAEEVANHKGNVWRHVISLRREDAERLGYNNAPAWKNLVQSQIPCIAENMKIPIEELRWYAAFHNTTHHPHIHMTVFSKDIRKGYLTNHGIENMRSAFANEIFHQDLLQIYQEKTKVRDDLKIYTREKMRSIAEMPHNYSNPKLVQKFLELAEYLKNHAGRKFYRFIDKDAKRLVDDIVSESSKDEKISELYKGWCEMQNEILRTYKYDIPDPPPLVEQKEFYSIKNMVITAAVELNGTQNLENLSALFRSGENVDHRVGSGIIKLFHHMSRMIQDQYEDAHHKAFGGVDRKVMRKILQKRENHGMRFE